MKVILLAALTLLAASNKALPAALTVWNFNSPTPDADTSTGTTNPSFGSGTANLVGGTTSTFVSGDTVHDPAGSSDNSGWQTTHYPAITSTNKSAGVRFDVNTQGYENISVSWYQRNSATASRYYRLQYTIDGNNFIDGDVIAIYADSVFTNKVVNLNSISGVTNNPNFGVRIVSEWEKTATGSGTNAFVATTTGSSYSTAGTVRFDMVTISGTPIAGANTAPTITTVSNQTIRVNHSTVALPITIGDAEDPASSLTLAKATTDPSVIAEADIVFGGAGASRNVTITAGSQTGSSTITLEVIDTGGRSNSTAFVVTVLPLNTSPVISSIPRVNTLQNTATPAIDFVVDDLETPAGNLTLSANSANPVLVPNGNIVFGGSGSNRTVTVTPANGQTGVAPITVAVSDGTNTASAVFPLMVTPSAEVIFYDPFSYPDGSILTNSGFLWSNRSGTEGECQVTNGQLQITTTQSEDIVGTLIGGPYTRSNNTVLYAGFKVNFLSLPKLTPAYFAHFASGSTLRGRIYASVSNAAPNYLRLFVANATDTNAVPLTTDLATNTPYTVVTRYAIDTATTTLWLNPTSESDPGVTATDTQSATTISAYDFRQDSTLGATLLIDELKVGLSFAAVLPNGTNAISQIPLQANRNGNNLILSWTNPAFLLQSSPTVTGAYTNVPGSSPVTIPMTSQKQFFRLKN
jgi:hypothetical protein